MAGGEGGARWVTPAGLLDNLPDREYRRYKGSIFPEREKEASVSRDPRYFVPNGKMNTLRIENPEQLGEMIRTRRRELGLTQTEVAEVANANLRFVSELERGKPTARLANVMRVLETLGIELEAKVR